MAEPELVLSLKDAVAKLLSNKMITSLLRDKKYVHDNGDYIVLEGDLNFSLRMSGDNITLDIHDIQPMIVARRFFLVRLKGRLTAITICPDKIILAIEGLGNVPIPIE